MPDFSKAREGDWVFDLRYGQGEVRRLLENSIYRVQVKFNSGLVETYTTDGFDFKHEQFKMDTIPMLYHSRPEITDPPPPKRVVRKTVWQNWYRLADGDMLVSSGFSMPTKDSASVKTLGCDNRAYIGTFSTELEYEEG